MKDDYAKQWLRLAVKSEAVVVGLAGLAGLLIALLMGGKNDTLTITVVCAAYAGFYAAIPVALFTSFIVALRAFGRRP